MTQDIDVVVDLKEDMVDPLCATFASDEFCVSRPAALEAARRGGQFNVIHSTSGFKIDVMIRHHERGRVEMARRERMQILPGLDGYCARPEDVILGKLRHCREGGSERHLRDVAGILKISGEELDRDYIHTWATKLGVLGLWEAMLRRVGESGSG